jgi:(S)-2-hydroxy-acid oxidase
MEVKNSEGSGLMKLFGDQIDPSISWRDVKWLINYSKLPIILKGIQCAADA